MPALRWQVRLRLLEPSEEVRLYSTCSKIPSEDLGKKGFVTFQEDLSDRQEERMVQEQEGKHAFTDQQLDLFENCKVLFKMSSENNEYIWFKH